MARPMLKFCNCAGCGDLLLGDSLKKWWSGAKKVQREGLPPPLKGRRKGRPYCAKCILNPIPGKRRPEWNPKCEMALLVTWEGLKDVGEAENKAS